MVCIEGHKGYFYILYVSMTYTLEIIKRDYSAWDWKTEECIDHANNIQPGEITINPGQNKLFHDDVVTHNGVLIKRNIKLNKIPGILLLHDNKTFGRHKNRLLYKCIPYDKKLPVFLVPYDLKIGFSKYYQNKYVIFSYINWEMKHPYGVLDETLGDVNQLENITTYLLHCNNLVYSNKQCQKKIGECDYNETITQITEKYHIPANEGNYVFSIDPEGSTDLDDALSVEQIDENKFIVRIYIANVLLWLDHLNLWDELTNQSSTIYFPNKKKSMLPNVLGDNFCSLLEKQDKIVQVSEFFIENNKINQKETKIYNSLVKINKNYTYNDKKLHTNKHFLLLQKLTNELNQTQVDSHELVSYWMVEANKLMASSLHKHKTGLYRTSQFSEIPSDVVDQHKELIQTYLHTHSEYTLYNEDTLRHEAMNEELYTHVTSPIRRIVDILNQYHSQKLYVTELTKNAELFVTNREESITEMNAQFKKIKKLQNQMAILTKIHTGEVDLNKDFSGIIIDKESVNTEYVYQIFIPELTLFQQSRSNKTKNKYDNVYVNMYYIQDEYTTYNKIRCVLLD